METSKATVINILTTPISPDLGIMIPIIRNMARKYGNDAADLFQEGMMAILATKAKPPADIASPKAWYITVARNAMVDYVRKHGHDSLVWDENEYPDTDCPADVSLETPALARILAKEFTLEELLLIGMRIEGKSEEEIGLAMGCSQQMISKRKRAIGLRLKKLFA